MVPVLVCWIKSPSRSVHWILNPALRNQKLVVGAWPSCRSLNYLGFILPHDRTACLVFTESQKLFWFSIFMAFRCAQRFLAMPSESSFWKRCVSAVHLFCQVICSLVENMSAFICCLFSYRNEMQMQATRVVSIDGMFVCKDRSSRLFIPHGRGLSDSEVSATTTPGASGVFLLRVASPQAIGVQSNVCKQNPSLSYFAPTLFLAVLRGLKSKCRKVSLHSFSD